MRRTLTRLAAGAALIAAIGCGQTDAGITTSIKSKLAADDTVKAYQIDVTTQDRVVTLAGTVETSGARDQALQIARGTDGVRDVVDQLKVGEAAATSGVRDHEPDVDVDVNREKIEAEAERGADKAREAGREGLDRAREAGRDTSAAAGRTAGQARAVLSDAALTTAVKAKLLGDEAVKGLRIDVDTKDGVVTLSGTVGTAAEAARAEQLAKGTDGVTRVVSNLRIGR